jgi:hypothetical protein
LLTNHSNYSSLGLHRQLRWVLTSCTGDFSMFGFFMQLSPAERGDSAFVFSVQESSAELGTPLVVGFCYIFASLRLSWCTIRLLHVVRIRVLILDSTSGP